MRKILYILGLLVIVTLQSCYDDYKVDYDYSTTYFANQYPLRTLIATADEELTFEVGVVIAGKRLENLGDEWVNFRLAPELIDSTYMNDYGLKVLPEEYYSLSNESEFDIVKGEGTRLSTKITIDKELFCNDELATSPVYALAFEIDGASTDSIFDGMNYTIVVLKYINEYHGDYFIRGVDYSLDATGVVLDTFRYGKDDDIVINDWTNIFETQSFTEISVDYVGRYYSTNEASYVMNVDVRDDGFCFITGNENSEVSQLVGSGEYNEIDREFILEYTYIDGDDIYHEVFDTAYYLNTQLKLETWK